MFDTKPPNASLLLAVEFVGPKIALRVDLDPFGHEPFDELPVLTLSLVPERASDETYQWLKDCVGAPFEAEVWPSDPGRFSLDVYVNFAADGVPLEAAWVDVAREHRSEADLRLLVRYLRRAASEYYKDLLTVEAADRWLLERLQAHLEHAIDNAQRKEAYFADTNPERARCESSKERMLKATLALIESAGREGAA